MSEGTKRSSFEFAVRAIPNTLYSVLHESSLVEFDAGI